MSLDLGWGREVFALAMALQNLIWGVSQPLIGMLADPLRQRPARSPPAASCTRSASLLMATTSTPLDLHLSAGVLLGLALGATGFGVVLAAVGRSVAAERRSMALGITTALGSLGQFLMPPLGQAFLAAYGWQTALMLLAFGSLATVALALGVQGRPQAAAGDHQNLRQALREARRHSGYLYLTAGFFVCGWHVAFISRPPAGLSRRPRPLDRDRGLVPGAGRPVQRDRLLHRGRARRPAVSKKYCLSALYTARAALILAVHRCCRCPPPRRSSSARSWACSGSRPCP